jgi:transcription antitermination factor NusG
MIRWYVMHSKHRNEDLLWQQLCNRNLEVYYPCICTRSAKPRTRKVKPYFPGYLFVHADLELVGTSTLQWIPGAIGLVTFGGTPASVPDGLLQRIRQHVDEMNSAEGQLLESLKPGDEVVIRSGPFDGYDAIFCAHLNDSERAQVLLKVLQGKTLRIDLPLSELTVAKQKKLVVR